MIVTYIPPEYIDTVWGVVGGMLKPATKYNNGRYTVRDAYHGIVNKNMQLWIIFDEEDDNKTIYGSIVTLIADYPSKKFLTVLLLGGKEMSLWIDDASDVLTRWAQDCGCHGIEGYARKGWERVLKRFGGKKTSTIFEKEFE